MRWSLAALAIALIGIGLLLYQRRMAAPDTGGPGETGGPVPAVRTAVTESGSLERTLRLSGVTAAERYVSLIAPQLHGRRGGMNVNIQTSAGGTSITVQAGRGGGGGGGAPLPPIIIQMPANETEQPSVGAKSEVVTLDTNLISYLTLLAKMSLSRKIITSSSPILYSVPPYLA